MIEHPSESAFITRARTDIVRGSLWTFAASLWGMPIGLAANVLVARSLGSVGLGRFATYVAIFAVVVIATNLGFSEATVQWLAAATARDDRDERQELIRKCAGFHIFVSGPAAAGCVLVLLAGSGPVEATTSAVAVWLTQALGTSTVVNTASARNAVSAQIALLANTAGQVALVTAAAVSGRPSTTWTALLVVTCIGPLLATFRLADDERHALCRPKLVLRLSQGFWTYAASACVGGLVASLVFGRSEVLVLRADGLVAGAGIFTVITGLAGQMTGPLDSLLAPLTPIAAGLMAIDRPRAIRAFERSLRVAAILGTFATCVLVPLGVVGIRVLYGRQFYAASTPFAVLGLVSCLQTVLGPMTAFAFATRSATQVLRINLACLIADAAIAISLVPLLGIWGAVLANGLAQLLSLTWMTTLITRRLDLTVATVIRSLHLFWIGLLMGAVEVAVCLTLRGLAELAVLAVVLAGAVLLRVVLARFPQLRLSADDIALITGAGASRKLAALVRVLRFAGITA